MLNHAQHVAGVAVLIVIPRDHLDKGAVQRDASARIEDGGGVAAAEIGGNHLVLGVSQHTGKAASPGSSVGSRRRIDDVAARPC